MPPLGGLRHPNTISATLHKEDRLKEDRQYLHWSLDSMEGCHDASAPIAPGFQHRPWGAWAHSLYPGLLVALTIGLAASWLSMHYGAPVMLFGLLLGIAFHFLHDDRRCVAGIDFAARSILRFGVALLGARITAAQIASLGIAPILMVVAGVVTTMLLGLLLSGWLGLSRQLGTLTGGAVAICGASAALAIASILPSHRDSERDTILTVVSVTALSTVAMIFYPILATSVHMRHAEAGIFLGGTIHDVAQVVGAGYMILPETGDIATYVKLLRVAMLFPVVIAISVAIAKFGKGASGKRGPLIPWFLVAFAILVAINSTGILPSVATSGMSDVSRWCLVIAIAALGMKTSFQDIVTVGWRPIALLVAETAWLAALVLVSVLGF